MSRNVWIPSSWPATNRKLDDIRIVQMTQSFCKRCNTSKTVSLATLRHILSRNNSYVFMFVMPHSLQKDTLTNLLEGHLRLQKCRERAKSAVWWPSIGQQLQQKIIHCEYCQENRPKQVHEPFIPTQLPLCPWQKVACDLCEGNSYLIIMASHHARYFRRDYLFGLLLTVLVVLG